MESMHCQCHSCWFSGHARSQDISSHIIVDQSLSVLASEGWHFSVFDLQCVHKCVLLWCLWKLNFYLQPFSFPISWLHLHHIYYYSCNSNISNSWIFCCLWLLMAWYLYSTRLSTTPTQTSAEKYLRYYTCAACFALQMFNISMA